MSDVIFSHGGTLDKYLGDGLMALFGAPFAGEQDALNAVRAAVEMQAGLEELNRTPGRAPLRMGIGIHTGRAIVGYMGTSRRLDYTAIGDTVNTASRLTATAERDQILISASTQEVVGGEVKTTALPAVKVKGKAAPVEVFEVPWK
jgi:adenylate cyclase